MKISPIMQYNCAFKNNHYNKSSIPNFKARVDITQSIAVGKIPPYDAFHMDSILKSAKLEIEQRYPDPNDNTIIELEQDGGYLNSPNYLNTVNVSVRYDDPEKARQEIIKNNEPNKAIPDNVVLGYNEIAIRESDIKKLKDKNNPEHEEIMKKVSRPYKEAHCLVSEGENFNQLKEAILEQVEEEDIEMLPTILISSKKRFKRYDFKPTPPPPKTFKDKVKDWFELE